jgi:hypothetical protein
MTDRNLPPGLQAEFLSFLRETDNCFEVVDLKGLAAFITQHGKDYPWLYELISINEEAVVKHYEETGEVPPGVKLIRTTQESENVTRLEVLHSPKSK